MTATRVPQTTRPKTVWKLKENWTTKDLFIVQDLAFTSDAYLDIYFIPVVYFQQLKGYILTEYKNEATIVLPNSF